MGRLILFTILGFIGIYIVPNMLGLNKDLSIGYYNPEIASIIGLLITYILVLIIYHIGKLYDYIKRKCHFNLKDIFVPIILNIIMFIVLGIIILYSNFIIYPIWTIIYNPVIYLFLKFTQNSIVFIIIKLILSFVTLILIIYLINIFNIYLYTRKMNDENNNKYMNLLLNGKYKIINGPYKFIKLPTLIISIINNCSYHINYLLIEKYYIKKVNNKIILKTEYSTSDNDGYRNERKDIIYIYKNNKYFFINEEICNNVY